MSFGSFEIKIIGLTGGICTGKSTVASILKKMGIPVIDADKIAKQILKPGKEAYNELVEKFGRKILDKQNKIDKKKLADLIFKNSQDRKALNMITHPRIRKRAQEIAKRLSQKGIKIAVYEAALLIENKVYKDLDGLILVYLPYELQLKRLMLRDNLDEDKAKMRIESQMPLEEKVKVADYIIYNQGSLSETKRQVKEIWDEIVKTRLSHF